MSTLKLGDLVQFHENPDTPSHGTITRVWNKPALDPYITIDAGGRTFVRCSSRVELASTQLDYEGSSMNEPSPSPSSNQARAESVTHVHLAFWGSRYTVCSRPVLSMLQTTANVNEATCPDCVEWQHNKTIVNDMLNEQIPDSNYTLYSEEATRAQTQWTVDASSGLRTCCNTQPGTGHRGTCQYSIMRSGQETL